MKNRRIGWNILWLCIFALFLWSFSFVSLADQGEEERVFDQAGLFTEEEISGLQKRISRQKEEMEMDLAVVTAFRQGDMEAQEYADLFYHDHNIGEDTKDSVFLYLIYMDGPGSVHGEYYLYTWGEAIRLLTDERLDQIGQSAVSFLADQDYGGSALAVLSAVEAYGQEGYVTGQYNYNTDTGTISVRRSLRWYEILAAVIAAAAAAGGACLAVVREYSMDQTDRRKHSASLAYQAQCRIMSQGEPDRLVNQFVTRHRISRPSSSYRSGGGSGRSSTYGSRGGGRHGGRGGRF